MARWKNVNWHVDGKLVDGHVYETTPEDRVISLLMDLRDEAQAINRELQSLNSLLQCPNFRGIPGILRGIRRKLPTPRKRRKPTTTKRRRVR